MPWLALALGLILAALEWRRPQPRLRLARVAAVLVIAAAFAVLTAPRPLPTPALSEAAIATAGLRAEEAASIRPPLFALAEVSPPPPGATVVSDVAALRRAYPALRTLHVYGHGLSPADRDRVSGLHVIAHPTAPSGGPAFAALDLPSALRVGSAAEVRGRIAGSAVGQRVRLEMPGLATVETEATAGGIFVLRTSPLPAAGRFLGKLSLRRGEQELAAERLGLAVTLPVLPRLLVLESAPRLDTARLKRWYADLGGSLAAHSQIARQRSRAAELAEARADFAELTPAALAGYDLVLLDPVRLGAFSTAERKTLEAAIAKDGLGLLLLGPSAEADSLSPWQTQALTVPDPASPERLVRPRWPERPVSAQTALPALPLDLSLRPGQQPLLTDVQGRALVASVPSGRGQLSVTLVRETWRWPQANEAPAFADYWSGLIERLARRAPEPGRWTLRPAEGPAPIVHHPLRLEWRGTNAQNPTATIADTTSPVPTSLALAQDPHDPTLWSSTFWPVGAGWHRLRTGNPGKELDFYVDAAGAWQSMSAQTRRDFTAELATRRPPSLSLIPLAHCFGAGVPLALILSCLSFLWIESRLARR